MASGHLSRTHPQMASLPKSSLRCPLLSARHPSPKQRQRQRRRRIRSGSFPRNALSLQLPLRGNFRPSGVWRSMPRLQPPFSLPPLPEPGGEARSRGVVRSRPAQSRKPSRLRRSLIHPPNASRDLPAELVASVKVRTIDPPAGGQRLLYGGARCYRPNREHSSKARCPFNRCRGATPIARARDGGTRN